MMMDQFRRLSLLLTVSVALSAGGQQALAQDGDAEAGERVFLRCKACHSLEAGENKIGPSLHNVVGQPAGGVDGFQYSTALAQAAEQGLVWTEENLVAYLNDPRSFLSEYLGESRVQNKMPFRLPDEQQRRDVIAYIESAGGDGE